MESVIGIREDDGMSYVARRQEITARALAASPAELDAMWAEDPEVAIDMAEVANHLPIIERALFSGVVALQIRAVASSSLPRIDPNVLREALPDLPTDARRVLFRRIRSKRLAGVAEALIETVHRTLGAVEAASLLPLCSTPTVARLLPALGHAADPTAVAKRHPELVLAGAVTELTGLESRDNWWRRHGAAIDQVVEHAPERVLDLVERFGPSSWLPFSIPSMTVLARTAPGRFIRLLEHRSHRLGRPAYRALAQANPPELVWLGRQNLVAVLRELPPSRRAEFFDAVHADENTARQDVPEAVLRLLPKGRRAVEARRMRAIAKVEGDEQRHRRLAAFLPFDEVADELIEATRSGEADERAVGYPLLIDCAATDLRLQELLPWLAERLRREQDPVRQSAIRALADASPRAFGDAAELTRIAADAFDALDFSAPTGHALARLCEKLLVHDGSPVALEILHDWWTRDGWHGLGSFGTRLRRGQEHEVFAALAKRVSAAARRVDFDPAFALARTFGRRAWSMPDLLELLWTAIPKGLEHASRAAIDLLLADPRHRNDRVARIVELDRSAVLVPSVSAVLQHSRTDLLDILLGRKIPKGRFAPKNVRVIPLELATRRWLPAQRARYAELVMTLADGEEQSRETRARAVRTLGVIHGPAKRNVLRYLASGDELIAQAALAVLPAADDPDAALDLLLDRALSDDRGQAELTSMYTIRRCARRVAPSHLAPKLQDALTRGGRVTVRKELVRLVSDFRLPGAVDVLRRVWDVPNQHRDVRAATAFVALSWLDDPTARELLREAVHGPREVGMQVLRVAPYAVPDGHRPYVAELIHGVATGPDDRLRAEALGALGNWAPWFPEGVATLAGVVTDLDDRAAWESAAHSLTNLVNSGAGEATIVDVLRLLLGTAGPDAEEDRDRPGLQRARTVINWIAQPWNTSPPLRDRIIQIAGSLTQEEVRRDALLLRLTTIRGRTGDMVDDLLEIERLIDGQAFLATAAAQRIGDLYWHWDRAVLAEAAVRLTDGHLQVGVLGVAGHSLGWPESWRAAVRGLRRHDDPGVRDAALSIRTAVE